jgi:hypothetical protein
MGRIEEDVPFFRDEGRGDHQGQGGMLADPVLSHLEASGVVQDPVPIFGQLIDPYGMEWDTVGQIDLEREEIRRGLLRIEVNQGFERSERK